VLCKKCTKLSNLHLGTSSVVYHHQPLWNVMLRSIVQFPNLETLVLQYASTIIDEDIVTLIDHCKMLKQLNIGGCYKLTDNSMLHLAANAPQITHLRLFRCHNLTDKAMEAMSKGLTRLTCLDLHMCIGLSDQSVLALLPPRDQQQQPSATPLPCLQWISFEKCRKITLGCIQLLREWRPHATILY